MDTHNKRINNKSEGMFYALLHVLKVQRHYEWTARDLSYPFAGSANETCKYVYKIL
jgi:hypothetical protein